MTFLHPDDGFIKEVVNCQPCAKPSTEFDLEIVAKNRGHTRIVLFNEWREQIGAKICLAVMMTTFK